MDPVIVLPTHYHEFLSVFSKSDVDKLPPHRPDIDHTIKLMSNTQPSSGPLYSMSLAALQSGRRGLGLVPTDAHHEGTSWRLPARLLDADTRVRKTP